MVGQVSMVILILLFHPKNTFLCFIFDVKLLLNRGPNRYLAFLREKLVTSIMHCEHTYNIMCPLCRIIIVISKVNHNHTHLQRIVSVFMMCFRDRLIESVSRKFAVSCSFVLFLYYFHNFFNGSLL